MNEIDLLPDVPDLPSFKTSTKKGMTHQLSPEANTKDYIGSLLDQNVNWDRELSKTDRFMLGGATPEEATQYIINKYPDKDVTSIKGRLMVRDKRGEGEWYPGNKIGFTSGDVVEGVGAEGQSILAGLLTAPVGGAIMAPLAGATGGLIGYAAREGTQELGGYQKQSQDELFREGAKRGLQDLAMGYTFTGGGKILDMTRGAGFVPPHGNLRRDIVNITNSGLPAPMPHQVLPPGSVAGRVSTQGASYSKHAQDLYLDQADAAVSRLRSLKGNQSPYRLGIQLEKESKTAVQSRTKELTKPFSKVHPEATGLKTKAAVNSWLGRTKKELNAGYANVRRISNRDGTVFDLTSARQTFDELGVSGVKTEDIASEILDLQGEAFTNRIPSFVNVAETPQGKLARVGFLLRELDPTQTNFEVIKQLRTQVGDVIENAPWNANINTGSAKKMYGVLTDAMKNPSNASPAYLTAFEKVNKKAANRFSILETSKIRQAIQTDDLISLGDGLGVPGGMTPQVRQVLATEPEKLNAISLFGMKKMLLNKNGARAGINEWIDKDPVGFQFLFGKKGKWMNDLADEIDKFNSSSLVNTVNNNTKPMLYAKSLLLDDGMSRADVQKLVTSYGGKGSKGHELLRFAILNDIAEQSIVPGKKTAFTVNSAAYTKAIKPYKKNGAWSEILTDADRMELQHMDPYARLILNTGQDVGTTLEQAQAVAKLKKPSTFIGGVHDIGMGKFIASLMMKPRISHAVTGSSGVAPLPTDMLESAALMSNAFTRSVIADPDIQEMLPQWMKKE